VPPNQRLASDRLNTGCAPSILATVAITIGGSVPDVSGPIRRPKRQGSPRGEEKLKAAFRQHPVI
jgi:hypothetical protein